MGMPLAAVYPNQAVQCATRGVQCAAAGCASAAAPRAAAPLVTAAAYIGDDAAVGERGAGSPRLALTVVPGVG
jgi:hypothetical protein